MCSKATPEPTGGFGELLFPRYKQKISQGWWALDAEAQCNTILMSALHCDGLYRTDSHIHTKGRCMLRVKEDDWLRAESWSSAARAHSAAHRHTGAHSLVNILYIFKGLLLRSIEGQCIDPVSSQWMRLSLLFQNQYHKLLSNFRKIF